MPANPKLHKSAHTYWHLLLADPWPEFVKTAPRGGKAAEALAHRRALESEFRPEDVARAIAETRPKGGAGQEQVT